MIKFTDIQISYGDFVAVDNLNLEIQEGEFFTFLGPSGCGKSTTLRALVGFNIPTRGKIEVGGRDVTRLEPEAREIGIVFQSYALFPTMTVYENIAFGLKVKKMKPEIIREKVNEVAKKIKITEKQLQRNVSELSGGQQQRVALARTLAQNPEIILADEPVAALDPVTAKAVMEDFQAINQDDKISILLNIHHVELALEYCDRIIGIRDGEVVYDGPSDQVTPEILDVIYKGQAIE